MKNIFGQNITVTLFGESHGAAIGAVLDGITPGIEVDTDFIAAQMQKRRSVSSLSTNRRERDEVRILSGVFNGKTTGTPIALVIENSDTDSSAYDEMREIARPGHADYTAYEKYHGFSDYRGGGHFSGRITAPLVAAGAIAMTALSNKGIKIATHLSSCAGVRDRGFENLDEDMKKLSSLDFAVLDERASREMIEKIENAKKDGDSVGGVLETVVTGLPRGVGEPWFDTVEGVLSHILFSVPAIKGVEFGDGFALADKYGSEANDSFYIKDGNVFTETNACGGILGGITNGMPLIFRCAVKPTPSIYKAQKTVNFHKNTETELQIKGRHDPCIVHRARVVVDSVTALALCDLLAGRYGTDYFSDKK